MSFEPVREKTCFRGFRPGPTQTDSTTTENGKRFDISNLESLGILRINHDCVDRINNFVQRVTAWHHEVPPSDAKQ